MRFRTSALTDIGRIRPNNEDSMLCDDTHHLYAVADGIGGLPGGAQASKAALETLAAWFARNGTGGEVDYLGCLQEINEVVFLLGRQLSPRHGIGTTLTVAHFHSNTLHVVHVGDTVLFRLRGQELETLTVEHNVENEMRARAARGEPVFALHENRAALTRCVGQPPPLEGDIVTHVVSAGDRYLVCSDGITRGITPREIGKRLAEAESPSSACRTLVDLANERGGLDNATAVVVFVDP
jgi:PPM family protein phosphatase